MSGLWRVAAVYFLGAAAVWVGLYRGTLSAIRGAADRGVFEELDRSAPGLLGRLDPNAGDLAGQLAELSRQFSFRLSLFDNDGRLIADSRSPGGGSGDRQVPAGEPPEVGLARVRGSASSIRFSTVWGEEMVFLARRLPGGTVLQLGLPRSADELLDSHLRTIFLLAGLAWLLGSLGALLLARHHLRKSQAVLSRWTGRLAQGELPGRVPLPTSALLGRLARTLENASEKLHSRIDRLEGERDHFNTVFGSILEGILVVDRRGRISDCNRSFREMFRVQGHPGEKLPLEIVRGFPVAEQIQAVLNTGGGSLAEMRHQGRVFRIQIAALGKPPRGAVCVFNDISDLRRLDELRKEFVSNVSHELKTPLTAIQGYAETLAAETGLEPLQEQFLSRIVRNARQLAAMIDQMLNLARVEARDTRLALEKLEFRELVEQLRGEFATVLRGKDLAFNWSAPENTYFYADRSYLYRVFRNLLENAIKYTDHGSVALRMERTDDSWLFTVEDSGIGIPREDLERIFERFYRAHRDRSHESGGSGIGLAIAKHIVQLHGGRIWAESQVDSGTRLSFTIPYPDTSVDPGDHV